MLISLDSPKDLGLAIRATRKAAKVRIDDLAATTGVSKQFAQDLEHGKEGIRLGLAMKIMKELGVILQVDVPDSSAAQYESLRATGLKPGKRKPSTRQV